MAVARVDIDFKIVIINLRGFALGARVIRSDERAVGGDSFANNTARPVLPVGDGGIMARAPQIDAIIKKRMLARNTV